MPYRQGGTDILSLIETAPINDIRQATGFSTSNYRYWGWSHQDWWGTKVIMDYSGYIYSGNSIVAARFLKERTVNWFSISRKGCRPRMTYGGRRWDTSSPNTYYVSKFADGEVWVGTTHNSRTGTRVGTAAENLQFVFVMLIGPGGGGGGGNGTTSGGGGGGGAFAFFCHRLVVDRVHRLTVGSGGGAGARNTNGGGGSNTQFATFSDMTFGTGFTTMNATGGVGGRSGGNSGDGGAGGETPWPSSNGTNIHRLDERNGMSGGNRGNNGSGNGALRTTAYTPEGQRLDYGQGGGGTGNNGGGGGSGWYFGHNGGAGGGTGGDGGIGAGGGGGSWVLFAGHPGGSGGNGYAALFY